MLADFAQENHHSIERTAIISVSIKTGEELVNGMSVNVPPYCGQQSPEGRIHSAMGLRIPANVFRPLA